MIEAKHALGPWTVDGPPHNQIVWSSPENRVCFLAHSNGRDDARDVATGHLIAAAPDMLEALYQIVTESGGKAIPNDRLTAAREKCCAAIAKAEGRS